MKSSRGALLLWEKNPPISRKPSVYLIYCDVTCMLNSLVVVYIYMAWKFLFHFIQMFMKESLHTWSGHGKGRRWLCKFNIFLSSSRVSFNNLRIWIKWHIRQSLITFRTHCVLTWVNSRTCLPGAHHWNYWRGVLSLCQIITMTSQWTR